MSLYYYLESGNFDDFCKELMACKNFLEKDNRGQTILHAIACKKEENALKTMFFKKSEPNITYVRNFEIRLRGTEISMKDALSIQDDNGDTPIHKAIASDNWHLAEYFSKFMDYKTFSPTYFRNSFGLTEYEYALVLYGVTSRAVEINSLFKFEKYNSGISEQSLSELKKACKAFKFISIGGSTTETSLMVYGDSLFNRAHEACYPSALSVFEDADDIYAFCKNNSLRPPDYAIDQHEEHKWSLPSVDDLLEKSNISGDKRVRFYSFICEFYCFTCYQCYDQTNVRNMAIVVICDASNKVAITKDQAKILDALAWKFIQTRSPARQEAYLYFLQPIFNGTGFIIE